MKEEQGGEMKASVQNKEPVESPRPCIAKRSAHQEWSDRVGQELCDNLNRHVEQEQREAQQKKQK